jgi:hypothetical protein
LFFYFSAVKLGFLFTISTAVATSLYRAQQFEAQGTKTPTLSRHRALCIEVIKPSEELQS